MSDGSPRHPISPQDAGFQAPQPGDVSLPQHDLVLPDTVPQTARDIWGPNAIRIHRVEGEGEHARGFLTVTPELVAWTRSLPAITGFTRADGGIGIGTLTPRAHFTGHFGGLLSEYKLLPGHYSERAGVMTAGLTEANAQSLKEFTGEVIPINITNVDFKGTVTEGNSVAYQADILGIDREGIYANITGFRGQTEIIKMTGVHIIIRPIDESTLPFDEIDEAAIQLIAVAALGPNGLQVDDQGRPTRVGVFKKITEAKHHQDARIGDELQIVPKGLVMRETGDSGLLMAGADVLNQRGELVRSYKRMAAGFIGFQEAAALFQGKAA